jgi:hypothetical protein
MRWVEHAARMGEMKNDEATLQSENVKGRNNLGDLSIHGRVILKWILKKQDMRVSSGFAGLRAGTSCGFL